MILATWNVNSLKIRLSHLLDWLADADPDVVVLQELKLDTPLFPRRELEEAGYYTAVNGQKTYNGVAILSKRPMVDVQHDIPAFDDPQKRVIAATIDGVRVVGVYVVNGQAVGSEKFDYKQRFLAAFRDYLAGQRQQHATLLVGGDFNIAPTPEDTHDPKAWEGGILCSDPERAAFQALLDVGLHDTGNIGTFTWWDYRQGAFQRDHGLRIDHWLSSVPVRRWWVDKRPRQLDRPSDHTPVLIEIPA
jgi:exodeoxyribonuclease-3